MFDFHGAGGNPNNQRRYSNLGALANRDGVILVNPNSRTSERPTKSAWHGTLYQPEDKARQITPGPTGRVAGRAPSLAI